MTNEGAALYARFSFYGEYGNTEPGWTFLYVNILVCLNLYYIIFHVNAIMQML